MSAPLSAKELGLMSGRPVPSERLVTHENQLLAPFNRWSFQNELTLNRTTDVWKGPNAVSELPSALQDLSGVTYQNRAGTTFTFDEMVEMSYTDGIVVLHKGRVIYERYLNGMSPSSLHAWASGSKSLVGVLAAHFAVEGLFSPDRAVEDYLPVLKSGGFAGATVRQVMDMTTAVGFPDHDPDPISESAAYATCMGWRTPTDLQGPIESIYQFLPRMEKIGVHGEKFTYQTPNTDVLAWLLTELTAKTLSELMHEVLWSRIGTERDGFWIVNPEGVETSGSGLLTTTRDMARLGRLLLQMGNVDGEQIIAEKAVQDIRIGGDKDAFARGPAASPMNQGQSYRNQWWVTHDWGGSFQALGYGGQILYIAPRVDLVIAKFSSFPTPTPAGNEFYSAMGAFPALVKHLA